MLRASVTMAQGAATLLSNSSRENLRRGVRGGQLPEIAGGDDQSVQASVFGGAAFEQHAAVPGVAQGEDYAPASMPGAIPARSEAGFLVVALYPCAVVAEMAGNGVAQQSGGPDDRDHFVRIYFRHNRFLFYMHIANTMKIYDMGPRLYRAPGRFSSLTVRFALLRYGNE